MGNNSIDRSKNLKLQRNVFLVFTSAWYRKIGLKVLKLKTYFDSIIDKLMRVYELEEILFDSHRNHRNNVTRCICLYRD